MKKALVLVLVLGLVVGSLMGPAAAGKKKKKKKKPAKVVRTVQGNYDTPAIGHPDVLVGCSGSTGCATIGIGPKERYIKLEVVDASGLPVYASAGQDLDGDQFADNSFSFCGTTGAEAVAVEPGYDLNIFISAFPGVRSVCAGAAVGPGKVIGKVSNLP